MAAEKRSGEEKGAGGEGGQAQAGPGGGLLPGLQGIAQQLQDVSNQLQGIVQQLLGTQGGPGTGGQEKGGEGEAGGGGKAREG